MDSPTVDGLVGDWPGVTCIYIPSLLVDHHIPPSDGKKMMGMTRYDPRIFTA